ncbi:uncharacterized protein LOC135946405 [Cloeon dipterum]|uniref:uncharacterized protein LOC135946405 n=1 Tax=Cloeon dipterum TaxID=197152 RepID=UPI00321FB9EF
MILYTEPYLKDSIDLHLQSFAGRGVVKISHIPKAEQKIRSTVVDWIFGVECYYKLPDMVSHIAIQTFDLILQALEVDEKDFQVVGGAAFWLASKLDQSKSISSKQMKKLIGSSCTLQRLKSAEEVVFKVLNYCLPRDSALSLLNYQLHVLKMDLHVDEEIRMIGQYVLESSMLIWSLAVRSYSFLASMSTMCAILLSGQTLQDKFWEEKAKTDVTFQPLRDTKKASSFILRKLMGVQEYGKSSGHLWIKFSSSEKLRVSLNPKLSAENIGKILKSVFCEEGKSSV